MKDPIIDGDAEKAIRALGQNFEVIGNLFVSGDGTPEALRMGIAGLRDAATLFERICDEWEALL